MRFARNPLRLPTLALVVDWYNYLGALCILDGCCR